MLWEELSAKDFPGNIKKTGGVCLLPIGVLEKHGDHLPVGTDMYIGQAVCKKAAEIENAVVFPYYFLGQIAEARHCPGCIAASNNLLMKALLEMCDEIGRNGFKKIIICSSHGGNNRFLPFFLQEMPRLNRSYCAYTWFIPEFKKDQEQVICEKAKSNDLGFHAGITETAAMMYLRPDLVNMKAQNPKDSQNMGRLAELREKGVFTGFNWYAQYPHHFAGDPSLSTPEIGKMVIDAFCENLAEVIRLVKADKISEKLKKTFNSTC